MERQRTRDRVGLALALALLLLAGAIVFSPYRRHDGRAERLIRRTVEIAAPCAVVFEYLGNSANASDWSVFVDHIVPLNTDSVPDGARGSIRRSFRRADETGMRWDEYFVEVEAEWRRLLRIYDVRNVTIRARAPLLTEQIYEPLAADRCRLSFTLFFEGEPTFGDRVAMTFVAYRLGSIFASNIANVKRIVEAGAEARPDSARGGG